jgi:hypothetical protein
LAGGIDGFSEFQRHVVGVIYNVPDRQDCGGGIKVKVS